MVVTVFILIIIISIWGLCEMLFDFSGRNRKLTVAWLSEYADMIICVAILVIIFTLVALAGV
ncbi:TPA: hypothetical protein OVL37_002456 [Staphylococcus aureus]|jgi:hypothetical protein|uniref:hypothetical protein n=1 Tax=Staphylococcus epidermidis TaxID=1282 RepID=UPI00024E20CD|nr:hypothetical protein [Staphylococcus epidermidis]EHR84413.1 hypothetical protein SEVCU120_2057 [Staphylococcus epidermidis VCU120]MBG3415863.1 hypothetical protein [Staphylococcus aureus]MDU5113591.1 hypothetical protein [Staphylococcus epidermidis]HCV0270575.1 hypothetical protein [Staphylococcus aureus]